MKEYKLIHEQSMSGRVNKGNIEKQINELALQGFKVVSSCGFRGDISSTLLIIMEKET